MNRRTFISAGVAVFALSTRSVSGEINANLISGTRATSELTGAEIDLGRTGFEFVSQMFNDQTGDELVSFRNDTAHASVRFVPSGTDTQAYLEKRFAEIDEQAQAVEMLGTEVLDDGGWMALSTLSSESLNYAIYLEFQLGAFPGYDLEVFLNTAPEAFQDELELVQGVLVEGMEPFLFTEESDVQNLTFPIVAASGTSSRSGRGSSRSGSGTTSLSESASSGQSNALGMEDDPAIVIEAVSDHQQQFMGELDRFYELVDMAATEDPSVVDQSEWLDGLLTLMFSWIGYPEAATDLSFPSDLATLESTYIEWAAAIGEMGVTMSAWILGDGDIDPFLDAIDVAAQVNTVLSAELRTLGVVINPLWRGFTHTVEAQLRALDRQIPVSRVA